MFQQRSYDLSFHLYEQLIEQPGGFISLQSGEG